MRVVSTVKFGWSAGSMMSRMWAQFAEDHQLLWILVVRPALWLGQRPFTLGGIVLAAVLMARGWWPPFAVLAGSVLPLLWAGRGAWRVLGGPAVAGRRSWRQSLTGLSRWRKLTRHWREAAMNSQVYSKRDERIPRLVNVHATATGISADIPCGQVGVTADKVAKMSDTLAASVPGVRQVTVTPGRTPGWAQAHFMWADPLEIPFGLEKLPIAPSGKLSFGITETGAPATISKIKSVLIVGQAGSGKSNALWTLITSAIADGVPIRLRVVDPAGGVELANLKDSPLVTDYADRPQSAVELVQRQRDAMNKRLNAMPKGVRKHEPTPAEPWDILVVDELLLLWDLLKEGTHSPLGEILSVGRKAAYSVWALTQIPHIDTLGRVRNLFVQKLVLATDTRVMTDAVLGDGAEAAGARCSKIPESMPGLGHAAIEGVPGYPRFRTPWIPDHLTGLIAAGHVPDMVQTREGRVDPLEAQPHVLYGWYAPNAESEDYPVAAYPDWAPGELLYLGISNNGRRRANEHVRDKPWAVWAGRMEIEERFSSRSEALVAEAEAIRSRKPRYNEVHNGGRRGADIVGPVR